MLQDPRKKEQSHQIQTRAAELACNREPEPRAHPDSLRYVQFRTRLKGAPVCTQTATRFNALISQRMFQAAHECENLLIGCPTSSQTQKLKVSSQGIALPAEI